MFSRSQSVHTKVDCKLFRLSAYVIANPAKPIKKRPEEEDSQFVNLKPQQKKSLVALLGLTVPSGEETTITSDSANAIVDNSSRRKQSHSIAPVEWNLRRERQSLSFMMSPRNLGS